MPAPYQPHTTRPYLTNRTYRQNAGALFGTDSGQCGLVRCSRAWWNDRQYDHLSKQWGRALRRLLSMHLGKAGRSIRDGGRSRVWLWVGQGPAGQAAARRQGAGENASVRVRTGPPLCRPAFPQVGADRGGGELGVLSDDLFTWSASLAKVIRSTSCDRPGCLFAVTSGGRGLGGPARGRRPRSGCTETAGIGSRHAGDVVRFLQGPAVRLACLSGPTTTGVFLLCGCNSRAVGSALSTDGDVPRQAASWRTTKSSSHFFNIWT